MLVTCSECGARISDWVDLCPRCGLPSPGHYSKKVNEEIVRKINEGRLVGELTPYRRCSNPNCDYFGGDISKGVKAELVKEKSGYDTHCWFKCPKCGTWTEGGRPSYLSYFV